MWLATALKTHQRRAVGMTGVRRQDERETGGGGRAEIQHGAERDFLRGTEIQSHVIHSTGGLVVKIHTRATARKIRQVKDAARERRQLDDDTNGGNQAPGQITLFTLTLNAFHSKY